MKSADIETISSCKLFQGIDKNKTACLLKETSPEIRSYEKGELIFSPGSFTRSLAVILSGSADVTKNSGSNTVYMSTLKAGNIFGMASLFYESEEYLTSVTAKSKCRVVFFAQENVDKLFRLDSAIGINYVTVLSERIHFLNKRIAEIGCQNAREKLLNYLTLSCERTAGGEILLTCSLSALASALSLGRTSLYRAFDALESEGIITKNGKNIFMR